MQKITKNKDWLYYGFGTFSADHNMQIDRQLFAALQSGVIDSPVLRFYRWKKPAISLGLNQKAEDVINTRKIEELNYDITQRPTGGHALLHKGDLCYAVISNRLWHPYFKTLSSSYRAISAAIYKLLSYIEVADSEELAEAGKVKIHLTPCFAMRSPFEVSIAGRKISGSSQYRSGDYFLQHGSLRVLDNWTLPDLEAIWPEGLNIPKDQITSIERELNNKIGFDLIVGKFVKAFCECFQVKMINKESVSTMKMFLNQL